MNFRITAKERGLIKGALRRVYARSELRKSIVNRSKIINYFNPDRPRVKKWSMCEECKNIVPTYTIEVDHTEPIIGLNETTEIVDASTIVERLWCDPQKQRPLCHECHNKKTKEENKKRRENKKKKELKNENTR